MVELVETPSRNRSRHARSRSQLDQRPGDQLGSRGPVLTPSSRRMPGSHPTVAAQRAKAGSLIDHACLAMTRPVEMPASAGMTQGAERLGAGLPVGCVQDGEIPASAHMTHGAERFRAGLPVCSAQEGEIPASPQMTHGAERLRAELLMCSVQGRGIPASADMTVCSSGATPPAQTRPRAPPGRRPLSRAAGVHDRRPANPRPWPTHESRPGWARLWTPRSCLSGAGHVAGHGETRLDHGSGSGIATSARTIFDDKGLARILLQLVTKNTSDRIRRRTRCKRHDDPHQSIRPAIRPRRQK